eukprot:scaffold926_cov113-Isochrysis_galbana.AAC.3
MVNTTWKGGPSAGHGTTSPPGGITAIRGAGTSRTSSKPAGLCSLRCHTSHSRKRRAAAAAAGAAPGSEGAGGSGGGICNESDMAPSGSTDMRRGSSVLSVAAMWESRPRFLVKATGATGGKYIYTSPVGPKLGRMLRAVRPGMRVRLGTAPPQPKHVSSW